MEHKKSDPYAAFLLVATAVLIAGMVFTWKQYKAMKAAETRLAFATKWWKDSLELEKQIKAFPQKSDVAGKAWTIQDVSDLVTGAKNDDVRKLCQEALKDKYKLDLNLVTPTRGTVMETWAYETLPLTVNQGRLDDFGMFVGVIEYLMPQAKTTLVSFEKPPDKDQGNGRMELTIYTEKEK